MKSVVQDDAMRVFVGNFGGGNASFLFQGLLDSLAAVVLDGGLVWGGGARGRWGLT